MNNSQTPNPVINTYKLLSNLQSNAPSSSTTKFINGNTNNILLDPSGFANYISTLNLGTFIPPGFWDMNIFASTDTTPASQGHMSIYFKLFGRTSGGVLNQISTNSSTIIINSTTPQQYTPVLYVPYTDISAYSSLVIQIFGNNADSGGGLGAIHPINLYFEGTSTYSHIHTSFANNGPSQWILDKYTIGKTGFSGFTGIGYTGNVGIFGDLYVSGIIDPTAIVIGTTGPNRMVLNSVNNQFNITGNTGGIYYGTSNMSFADIVALPKILPALRSAPEPNTLKVNYRILCDSEISTIIGDYRNDYLIIIDSNTGDYYSFNKEVLQVNNPSNPSYINMSPFDGLSIQNDVKGGQPGSISNINATEISIKDQPIFGTRSNTLDAGSMTISDGTSMTTYIDAGDATFTSANGQYTTMTPSYIQMFDGNTNLWVEINNDLQEPFIRMRNIDGINNYYYRNSINADTSNCFIFDNNQRFYKQQNPFSFNYYTLDNDGTIEKYMSFVYCYNLSGISLNNPNEYLDDNGFAGWSCIVSNHSGNELNIKSSTNWYAQFNGEQSSPIIINKWATCRITLIFNTSLNEYFWSVSQF